MKGYIIKVTYLTGPYLRKSYFLIKGGYVTDNLDRQWTDTCYKTENICRSVCRKLQNRSDIEHEIEAKQRVRAAFNGKHVSEYRLYEKELFEPYEVKTVYSSTV